MDSRDPSTIAPGIYEAPDGSRRRVMWVGLDAKTTKDGYLRQDKMVRFIPVPTGDRDAVKMTSVKAFLKWALHKSDEGDFVRMVPDYA